jgi:hypothetical protein
MLQTEHNGGTISLSRRRTRRAFTVSNRIKPSFKYGSNNVSVTNKINVKLMWFIHGAEKEHRDIPAFSDKSIASKKRIPKSTFGPCNFDSLSFFSPGGHYAMFDSYTAVNMGTIMCNNGTEQKFEKIPDQNGMLELRDMIFLVQPNTDPDVFKEGMSVYLCINNVVTRIHTYNDLVKFGTIDLKELISRSNKIMEDLGHLYRKWDLLLCCCRVYQPNVVMVEDEPLVDAYAPSYVVTASTPKPDRRSATSIEKKYGVPKKVLTQRKNKRLLWSIRMPKKSRTETAKRSIHLTTHGGRRSLRIKLKQVSEDDFYKSLSPVDPEKSKSKSK